MAKNLRPIYSKKKYKKSNDIRIEFNKQLFFKSYFMNNFDSHIFSGNLEKLKENIKYLFDNNSADYTDDFKAVKISTADSNVLDYLLEQGMLPDKPDDIKFRKACLTISEDVRLFYALTKNFYFDIEEGDE